MKRPNAVSTPPVPKLPPAPRKPPVEKPKPPVARKPPVEEPKPPVARKPPVEEPREARRLETHPEPVPTVDVTQARRDAARAERQRKRYERAEARRFTERTRRRRLGWLVAAGTLLVTLLLVLFAAYSPVFAVRTVSIEGTSRIDAATLQAALTGEVGKPLALVDYAGIQSDLAAFPLIQSYSTESQLPNTLVIRIVERQPVGAVVSGTGFDLVDPAGVTVQHVDTRPAGTPLIDLTGTTIGSAGFTAATSVLRSLPADLLAKVDTVSAATPDSVTLVLTGVGQKVVWGSVDQSALKARVLDRLVPTQDADAKITYDVSSPEAPVVS